ncbi:HET-domain-containing protein [Lophiostoma macrostomum CBS 122681]|uniref:HET-domain-containing protein n=1 Tax=Lophiostoma macrostomum CBS 122681 TaxID=1314788 RepID=A0A6A6SKK6_9PLEO|nr:HET-domain-containing protein [Lophiostoma macrostomum CBS 122681]
MKMWISNCLECTDDKPHSRCRDTLAHSVVNEEDSPIPAERIIDVGLDDTDNVRLALTNDTRGRYCALSHCWGPVDKRPTCVTRANEDSFFAGIEVGGLSRTFQDAILVTRGLGIRYLWIDSLCIVQDDVAHWRQESARMGSIYENAFLRIAASGATNSTEGLFQRNLDRKTSEKRPPTIDLRQKNSKQALIHFRAARENTNGDHISPLARRAWVFQESRLSRRTIFFNRPGITWECRACRMNERNHTDTVPRSQMYSWTKHVEDYSDCVLTYESDRLIALEGLASELGKLRPDTYHLGTWLGDVSGLMWRIVEPEVGMRGLPDLPSWTWASRPGRKRFATGFGPIKRADGTTSTISFQDNGRTLILEASLTECIVTDDRFVNLLRADGKGGTTPTGLVRFDDASDYQRLHCSMLGTDWNSALISQPNDILRGDTPKGENYYWALFLQPIENRQDHYRRVGIGLIWSTPDIEDYLEKQTFHLV